MCICKKNKTKKNVLHERGKKKEEHKEKFVKNKSQVLLTVGLQVERCRSGAAPLQAIKHKLDCCDLNTLSVECVYMCVDCRYATFLSFVCAIMSAQSVFICITA